ncbi:platelet-activating factor acetylhydrolase 2, cytoplasmic [Nothoprocta perdicaria]|uniref:platelet-activating factor acetylhydrolase 2, cytoplasmic n=1 Tax=Nothoprocta perdicaria TaxID=30464 RepID=UPI000E1B6532|nr:platelet-activating factor acetylhydrolase 2, cytoplasmic [Nothoprocta perdicaria]
MGWAAALALPRPAGPHHVGCADVMVGRTRQGLFFRLYYPCEPHARAARPLWIPRAEYFEGLVDVGGRRRWWSAPLLRAAFSTFRVPLSWNSPFKPGSAKYPLIIFSHGLGAFRTLYSAVCAELASRGFVVAALEHRDRSASATYFCTGEPGEALREEWIPYGRVPPGEKEFYFRNKQLHQRADECARGLQLFEDISRGQVVPNVLHGAFDLSVLQGSIDMTKVAIMGHSFGGVTAVLATVKEPRFSCAVALDAWMFPLEHARYPDVSKPLLFINNEKFQTPESIARMKRLRSRNSETKAVTILGSVHHSQSDITFLTGKFEKLINRILTTRGTLDPHKVLGITCQAALAFLQRHLDLNEDFDQWDPLLDGIGDSVVADEPLCRSNL